MSELTVSELTLTVGGRVFRPVGRDTTFAHQLWMAKHLHAAGIYDVLTGKVQAAEADAAEAILWRAVESGRVLHLLAGSVVEDGTSWTPAEADRIAGWFGTLTSPDDCRALQAALVGLLFSFFESGPPSSKTSAPAGDAPSGQSSSADGPLPPANAEPSTSVSGAM